MYIYIYIYIYLHIQACTYIYIHIHTETSSVMGSARNYEQGSRGVREFANPGNRMTGVR